MSDDHAPEIAGPYSLSVDTYFGRTRWWIEMQGRVVEGPFYDNIEAWNRAQVLNLMHTEEQP